MCVSKNGRLIAARCFDNFIRVWDISNGKLLVKKQDKHVIGSKISISFIEDELLLVSASYDKHLRVSRVNVFHEDEDILKNTLKLKGHYGLIN